MSSATRNSVEPPSLAIVGGGIAGLTLAIALLTHAPHLPITLYESASAFGEIGAGVAFEPVMVRTMRLIDPRVVAAFEKCSKGNTPPGPRVWMRIRVGDQRKVIGDPDERLILDTVEKKKVRLEEEIFHIPSRGEGPRGGVHRAHLLDELVKLIPEGVAQFRKRLVDITRATDGSGWFSRRILSTNMTLTMYKGTRSYTLLTVRVQPTVQSWDVTVSNRGRVQSFSGTMMQKPRCFPGNMRIEA